MEKMTSEQSLKLAADTVYQQHEAGNSYVKIAFSDISHDVAVSYLKSGSYEVSSVDAYFVSGGFVFVAEPLRRWKFLAVEPINNI